MSFAKAVLSGVLASDPEKRFTPNNHAVTSFNLLVENAGNFNRAGSNEPFVVKVTCWRGLADTVTTQLHKGDNVLVEGKLLMNSFQGQDGVQKKLFEVEAASIDKLSGRPEPLVAVGAAAAGEGGQSSSPGGGGGSYQAAAPASGGGYASKPESTGHFTSEDLMTEDDIPF